jgi:tetratricopeptide (TPR) repeat protein
MTDPTELPFDATEQASLLEAREVSDDELAQLEAKLAAEVDDVRATVVVAGALAGRARVDPDRLGAAIARALERRPLARVVSSVLGILAPITDPAVRERVLPLVEARIATADGALELGGLATFFMLCDPERYADLLRRARELDPEHAPAWDAKIRSAGKLDFLNARGRAATEHALGRALPSGAHELTREDAAELEQRIAARPDDRFARAHLAQAYFVQSMHAAQARHPARDELLARLGVHVGWLVDHAPGSAEAGESWLCAVGRVAPEVHADLAERWERALAANAQDAHVHANAARFFATDDEPRALALLECAARLEPDEPEWSRRIAQQLELRSRLGSSPGEGERDRRRILVELERARAHEEQRARDDGEPPATGRIRARFSAVKLAEAALAAGELERAEQIARELLEQGAMERWQLAFDGGPHHGHLVLGRVALRRGDVAAAAGHLRAATEAPFPFRGGWKSHTALARDLFDAGERDAVRAYLEASLRDAEGIARKVPSKAPSDFTGREEIAGWLAALDAGERPAFSEDR